jgi:hypothetical protein
VPSSLMSPLGYRVIKIKRKVGEILPRAFDLPELSLFFILLPLLPSESVD